MIKSADDLKKYRGCGILGYSYAHYNIQSEQLDLTPDYGAIYRKLNAGRCDYFLDELETFADDNDIYSKEILTNPLIVYASASWASSPSSYLVTRKAGPGAEVLKDFNRALKIVIKNGSAAKIWKKGMGDIPFKP